MSLSTKKSPTASIIIPTKDRALTLKKCLKKLIPQIGAKDEVIVVNNGSRDQTKKVVSTYQKISPIKYLEEPRTGPSYARNLGITKAKGEIIVFLDDDCLVSSQWLSKIKETRFEQTRDKKKVYQGKIIHRFKTENIFSKAFALRNKIAWNKIKQDKSWKKNRYINFLNAGNFFLHKSVVKNFNNCLFDAKTFPFIGEEWDLALKLQKAGYKIIYQNKIKVTHLKNEKTLYEKLKTAFLYGRAESIIKERYLVKRNIRKLFRKEIKQNRNKIVNKDKILLFDKDLFQNSFSLFICVYIYLIIREIVYHLGKFYGKIAFKFLKI